MKSIDRLLEARDLSKLAKLLGYNARTLSFIVYVIPDADKYKTFTIPKKTGGEREIKAPISRLKVLQRRLAALLQDCFEELYGVDARRRALSHGFRRGHSILTNANNHGGKRYVFNIDLDGFFPSINFGRVRGYFISNRDFQLNPSVATVIAQIACHNNELPQGSPLSPVISNLIGNILDIRLVRLAKKARCVYSRYADDITFSTREKCFPAQVAAQNRSRDWVPGDELEDAISRSGFRINRNKISMQYRCSRQMATGLVVNERPNIRADYYRQARAMCNSLFRTGEFYLGADMRDGGAKDGSASAVGKVDQLRGILSHIYHVKRSHQGFRQEQRREWPPKGTELLVERFLCFDRFHNLARPLVVCEGKTDVVYLECALKSLARDFPSMIQVAGGKVAWKIDFFRYAMGNMSIRWLRGGTGDLKCLIHRYKKLMEPFVCRGPAFPVILVADNDDGAKGIKSVAKKLVASQVDGTRGFYRLVDNLYLVLLPPRGEDAVVEIEDYFDQAVRDTKVDGKMFVLGRESNEGDSYGKAIFAERVVRAGQAGISFERFRPLLGRIDGAIADYAKVSRDGD